MWNIKVTKFKKLKYDFACRALLALRQCLPDQLRDNTFATCLQEDQSTKHWLSLLLKNLETGPQPGPPTQPGQDPRTIGMSPLTSWTFQISDFYKVCCI